MIIWKYPIDTTSIQRIEMPLHANILCVQIQGGIPCIWAMVEGTTKTKENKIIQIVGTGHAVDDRESYGWEYIGTYQLNTLVYHVFEDMNYLDDTKYDS